MIKRWMIAAITAMLVLVMSAGTVSAASAPKPIHIVLNGQEVVFSVAPKAISGKTYVEFRTLFQTLGYKVDYVAATKKIKATSSVRSIEMSTSGTSALIDGKKVATNGEMKIINGRTLVGVRFIATLSAKKVEWNAAKQTVFITDIGPTAQQKAAVFQVLTKLTQAEAAGDANAFLAVFHSKSPQADGLKASIPDQFARMKTQTVILDKEIDSYSAAEAVLVTTEQTRKVSGTGFFPDNVSQMSYTLRKETNGQWAIYSAEQLSLEVLDVDSLWKQEIQAPDADQQAIKALLDAQAQAINEEDVEAYGATINQDYPGAEEDLAGLADLFASVNLKMVIEKSAIVEISEDSASILASVTVEQTDGDDIPSTRSISLMTLTKVNGKWLLDPGISDLYSEDL
ncbi:stalk domain-containing protein [Paenibacillus solisilvae]|uniref:Stalk domain-containing protein n=1 Tax=Paenibacillus solisilvae TaxID=2486751 RepID=A0ABW0W438_9BACL